jgi:hypothetical protein
LFFSAAREKKTDLISVDKQHRDDLWMISGSTSSLPDLCTEMISG